MPCTSLLSCVHFWEVSLHPPCPWPWWHSNGLTLICQGFVLTGHRISDAISLGLSRQGEESLRWPAGHALAATAQCGAGLCHRSAPVLTRVEPVVHQVPLWRAAYQQMSPSLYWCIGLFHPRSRTSSWLNPLMSLPAHFYILSKSLWIAALQLFGIFVDICKGTVSKQSHYQGNTINSFDVVIIDWFYVLIIKDW